MSLLSWLQKSATAGSRESLAPSSRKNQGNDQCASNETTHSTSSTEQTLIPESPNQQVFTFPQWMFGSQQRSFCSSWYNKYPWLHYLESTDSVLCFYCMVADRRGLPVTKNKDEAFCKAGFTNWKKALEKFEKHQNTGSIMKRLIWLLRFQAPQKMLEKCSAQAMLARRMKIEKCS